MGEDDETRRTRLRIAPGQREVPLVARETHRLLAPGLMLETTRSGLKALLIWISTAWLCVQSGGLGPDRAGSVFPLARFISMV